MTIGLTVDRLSVDRGGRPVLRDLSFHLAPGAAILVTGSNGAGKSTLLRAIGGLIPRVGGEVRLLWGEREDRGAGVASPSPVHGRRGTRGAGSDEGKLSRPESPHPSWLRHDPFSRNAGEGASAHPDLQEHTAYLGHGNGLKLSLTAAENIGFAAAWAAQSDVSPVAALEAVGLAHVADFPVRVLSAGQRRRVALAMLLVSGRPLWLLDEPATALDATAEAQLGALLRAHLGAGGMILAAIHSPLDLPARQLRLGAA